MRRPPIARAVGGVGPTARLSAQAQERFDLDAQDSVHALARVVGVTCCTLEKLRFGGRARPDAVAKVEAHYQREEQDDGTGRKST